MTDDHYMKRTFQEVLEEVARLREQVQELEAHLALEHSDESAYMALRSRIQELESALREMVEDAPSYSTGGCGADECGTQHDCGSPVVFRDFPSTLRARDALKETE